MHQEATSQAPVRERLGRALATPTGGDLARELAHAERRVADAIAEALNGEGVSIERWRVLTVLTQDSGRPMSAVAAEALLAPPTLTKVVDRLVAEALVHRNVDPADRRRVLVLLTARGRALQRRLDKLVEQQLRRTLLDVDTGDLGWLVRVLGQIRG